MIYLIQKFWVIQVDDTKHEIQIGPTALIYHPIWYCVWFRIQEFICHIINTHDYAHNDVLKQVKKDSTSEKQAWNEGTPTTIETFFSQMVIG